MKARRLLPLVLAITLGQAAPEPADAAAQKAKAEEKAKKEADLAKRQCRSIHLNYTAPAARAAYLEVTPEKTSAGTYFCALGFKMGYLGIQDLGDGQRIAIFSVWDPGGPRDAKTQAPVVPSGRRVELIEKGEDVIDGRFGGEGTGAQSRLPFHWETGKPTRFFVQARVSGDATELTAHVFDPAQLKWKPIATFRTHVDGPPLEGIYSFVEDFRRNYESARIARKASFDNGWVMDYDGKWQPLLEAKFTGDMTPSTNIDAGPATEGFFLQTGGDTENKNAKLRQKITRETKGEHPVELEALLRP